MKSERIMVTKEQWSIKMGLTPTLKIKTPNSKKQYRETDFN